LRERLPQDRWRVCDGDATHRAMRRGRDRIGRRAAVRAPAKVHDAIAVEQQVQFDFIAADRMLAATRCDALRAGADRLQSARAFGLRRKRAQLRRDHRTVLRARGRAQRVGIERLRTAALGHRI
jgi:hypothetical protein